MEAKQSNSFLECVGFDPRINVWHLALLVALLRLAYIQNEREIIKVSRSKLMKLSHIKTLPTYHKYFKQLQDFGYITYMPSYHPGFRSTVTFNKFLVTDSYIA